MSCVCVYCGKSVLATPFLGVNRDRTGSLFFSVKDLLRNYRVRVYHKVVKSGIKGGFFVIF